MIGSKFRHRQVGPPKIGSKFCYNRHGDVMIGSKFSPLHPREGEFHVRINLLHLLMRGLLRSFARLDVLVSSARFALTVCTNLARPNLPVHRAARPNPRPFRRRALWLLPALVRFRVGMLDGDCGFS